MDFHSQYIQIGSVQIQYYGIIIVTAMIAATFVALNLAIRTKRDPEHVYGALTWAIIPGIIFARMWFVFFPPVTSVNTFVEQTSNIEIVASQLLDEEGQLVIQVLGTNVQQVAEGSALADEGIEVGDSVTGVEIPGSENLAVPSSQLFQQLATQSPDETITLEISRDVPKDRNFFLQNFFDLDNGAIAIWSGGLSIFGALLGGFMGVYVYMRKNGLPLRPWLDIAAVVLPLSQAIGRWANYVNQELFGATVSKDFFLALKIPQDIAQEAIRAAEGLAANAPIQGDYLQNITVENGELFYYFHPLFLYESLWSLAAFGGLLYIFLRFRDRFRPGDFLLMYIVQYSFIRFVLEFLRLEVTLVGDVNLSQLVTGAAGLVALALLVYRMMNRSEDERPYDEIDPPVWPDKPEKEEDPRKLERKAKKGSATDEESDDGEPAAEAPGTA